MRYLHTSYTHTGSSAIRFNSTHVPRVHNAESSDAHADVRPDMCSNRRNAALPHVPHLRAAHKRRGACKTNRVASLCALSFSSAVLLFTRTIPNFSTPASVLASLAPALNALLSFSVVNRISNHILFYIMLRAQLVYLSSQLLITSSHLSSCLIKTLSSFFNPSPLCFPSCSCKLKTCSVTRTSLNLPFKTQNDSFISSTAFAPATRYTLHSPRHCAVHPVLPRRHTSSGHRFEVRKIQKVWSPLCR